MEENERVYECTIAKEVRDILKIFEMSKNDVCKVYNYSK